MALLGVGGVSGEGGGGPAGVVLGLASRILDTSHGCPMNAISAVGAAVSGARHLRAARDGQDAVACYIPL